MAIPLYLPPHSGFHQKVVTKVPLLGDALRAMAMRLEVGADWRHRDSAGGPVVNTRWTLALPTSSHLNRQVLLRLYPLVGGGVGWDFGGTRFVGVLSYGAGLAVARPAGTQRFLEWRRTKFSGIPAASIFALGIVSRPPGRKPWCPRGETCPGLLRSARAVPQ